MNNILSAAPRPGPSVPARLLRLLIPIVLTAVSVLFFLTLSACTKNEPDYSWTDYTYICHAMGAVDDITHYTNTAEAFRINYEKGYRVFELDLEYTSDGKLVCLHSWLRSFFKKHLGIKRKKKQSGVPMTYDEFMALTFFDKYPASDFSMICEVLKECPDAWLVLDGKVTNPDQVRSQYTELVNTLKEISPESLPHVIPQIYTEEMLDIINDIYPWNSVIFTLYQLEEADADIRAAEEASETAEAAETADEAEEAAGNAETLKETAETEAAFAGTASAAESVTAGETPAEEPKPVDAAHKIVSAEGFDPLREIEFAAEHKIGMLTISYELFKAHPEIVPGAHEKGIKVFVHTVDSGKKWARLQKADVDGIYTNRRLD